MEMMPGPQFAFEEKNQINIMEIAFHDLGQLAFDPATLERSRSSPGVLVVPVTAHAEQVAHQLEGTDIDVVLVTDEHDAIRGLVAPHWIQRQIARHLNTDPGSFGAALVDLRNLGKSNRGFAHEWLNFQRPDLLWCVEGGHYTYTLPCPTHT